MGKGPKLVGCTSCRRCLAVCPQHIPIPTYLRLLNDHLRAPESDDPAARYAELAAEGPAASDCVGCRACCATCMEYIMIPEMLAEVAGALEGK